MWHGDLGASCLLPAARRLFVGPHLPRAWARLRRAALRRGRPKAADAAQLAEHAARVPGAPPGEPVRDAERELPPLRVRGGALGRRVVGNAARSSVSLCAMAAGVEDFTA